MMMQSRFNLIGEWIFRLTLLNLLWLGFTLVGLGFSGIFPATSAVFAVIRQYRLGHKKVILHESFISYYKKDFLQSNLIGYCFLLLLSISWLDYRYLISTNNYWLVSLSILFLIASLVIILAAMLVFAFYVHYQLPFWKTMMNPFRFMIMHLRRTLLIILLLAIWISFVRQLPGVLPFLGTSIPIFIIHRLIEPILIPSEGQVQTKQRSYLMKQEEMLYY